MENAGVPHSKFDICPRCKQERMLVWYLATVNGTEKVVSGYMCKDCFHKMQQKESEH